MDKYNHKFLITISIAENYRFIVRNDCYILDFISSYVKFPFYVVENITAANPQIIRAVQERALYASSRANFSSTKLRINGP